ncbi:hypothetical protein HDU98_002078 [Podochytrium sp. JEL0797]|nr:hypothetical protein HDU98_002078 [Podochytrium sp. JEL0797]
MDVIADTLLEELTEYTYTLLLDAEIEKEIKRIAVRVQTDHPERRILIHPNPRHKSESVTHILDSIVDRMMLNHLVDHVATRGRSFMEWDAGDRVVDAILADVLMQRYLSLREAKFDGNEGE